MSHIENAARAVRNGLSQCIGSHGEITNVGIIAALAALAVAYGLVQMFSKHGSGS